MEDHLMRILFVTWDGPQVDYLEGLFLPLFKALQGRGYEFHVLQFTWGDKHKSEAIARSCVTSGINYRRVEVSRRFGTIGAFFSAWFGARHLDRCVSEWSIDTLMARSLMPAISVLRSDCGRSCKLIFDSDGLAADERVDFAGLSAASLTYRLLRDIEAQMVRRADAVLVRTTTAREILLARAGSGTSASKFFVVTNGKDPTAFPLPIETPAKSKEVKLCYIGSIGAQYEPQQMLDIAVHLKKRFGCVRLDVFTRDQDEFYEIMKSAGMAHSDWISMEALHPADAPSRLSQYDVGFALRSNTFSMQGVAPIKIAEYLLAGVPIIGSADVGDVSDLISKRIMIVPNTDNFDEIGDWIESNVVSHRQAVRTLCRSAGEEKFSISNAIRQYSSALESV